MAGHCDDMGLGKTVAALTFTTDQAGGNQNGYMKATAEKTSVHEV